MADPMAPILFEISCNAAVENLFERQPGNGGLQHNFGGPVHQRCVQGIYAVPHMKSIADNASNQNPSKSKTYVSTGKAFRGGLDWPASA